MAGVTQYILKGGPCDGKTGLLTPEIETTGQLTCQNHIYKITYPVQNDGGREVFKDAGAVPKPKPKTQPTQSLQGWKAIRKSVNVTMRHSLQSSRRSSSSALRSLSRARKVRL